MRRWRRDPHRGRAAMANMQAASKLSSTPHPESSVVCPEKSRGLIVSEIKKQLQSEGFEKSFINGPTLRKELQRRIEASRAKIDGTPQS
jgi:hypothetical protein